MSSRPGSSSEPPGSTSAEQADGSDVSGWGLGSFRSPGAFRISQEISANEFAELEAVLTAVDRLKVPFHFQLVARNLQALEDVHQFVSITVALGRVFANPERRVQLAESVMSSMVNWLSSMRLFLDHEQTELTRRFGSGSSEVRRFKSATSEAYDGSVGYRFAYRFRNYVQHCGLPLSSMQITENVDPSTMGVQRVVFLVDRDALVDRFDAWGPQVSADLAGMPGTFEVLPLIRDAMAGLTSVQHTCTDVYLDDAIRLAPRAASALAQIDDRLEADRTAALFRYSLDPTTQEIRDISPRLISADAIAKLTAVREGRLDRSTLWRPPEQPRRPDLDPATVRERFHRDSRGVQILTAWMQEGGGTQAFFEVVNTAIEEDQGIEPLITGLINTSALLAHLSGAALGTTAPGIVGGLLDMYSQFDRPVVQSTEID
jgi:hypothetical protein